ncbi:MAG: slipin family protein, partial [Bacteroidota bacterium]
MFRKEVRINEGRVGLVFRKGDFLQVLNAGKHKIRHTDGLKIYNRSQAFVPDGIELNVLLEKNEIVNELTIVEVPDQHLMLMYTDRLFTRVLGAGKHAYWKGVNEYRFELLDLSSAEMITSLSKNLLVNRELLAFVRLFEVMPAERGVLLVDGEFVKELTSGMYYFWRNATPIQVLKTDMRQRQLEIS